MRPEQLSSEELPLPTELKTRAQAHAAMEELDLAREQLYSQLYAHDNMLGYHYLKNYPMTPTAPKSTQNYRRLSNEFPPATAAPASAAPATPPGRPEVTRKESAAIVHATPSLAASAPASAPPLEAKASKVVDAPPPRPTISPTKSHKGGKDKSTGHKPFAHEASMA